MGILLRSHFVLFGVLIIVLLLLVQAQDQSGFISLDCGLPENSSYTEKSTGINYISDAAFIGTGVSKSVSHKDKIAHPQQLSYLRSFPSGVRNCYTLNVESGNKYLIRASFLYGNYDGLNVLPQFDLHLGPNFWGTVKLPSSSMSIDNEIIYSPSLDYIHLCLVNTGSGTPFISAIELRTLDNFTYSTQPGESLARIYRLDFGSKTNLTYRYEDDVFDRLWEPYSSKQWTQLSSKLGNDDVLQNHYKPPAVVLSTAATPKDASAPLTFSWVAGNVTDRYYFYLHFCELQKLAENETREFTILLNGAPWFDQLMTYYRTADTEFSLEASYGSDKYEISLVRTQNSTHPPIINALEVYLVKDLSQLETHKDDAVAITNIKIAYNLTKNWQGDPCAPVAYMWNGLDCRFDDAPRITSLNLSSSGLTGHISSFISKLAMLEFLDLSNNSLSGEVPNFLTQLQSLKVLNLGNNNLTGLVPNKLVQSSNDGLLSLSLGQNPNLCGSDSCNQQKNDTHKKKNVIIPIVASIAGILVLLAVAAISCGIKAKRAQETNNPYESKQRQYSFDELVKITNNFDKILGKGGFGNVYHGFIDDTQVAIKMLSSSSTQGYQQFVAEVNLLMKVHHRNLTSLIGYCHDKNGIGLVYEYMANGNLDEHLSGRSSEAMFLTWEDRLQIAMDAAQGLEYLHVGCKPPIIHRDVKCANILLNGNLQAKLADFGLSKAFSTNDGTHVSTVIAGTLGYLDPEYGTSNWLTEKSDVYSFGVVLLEIITGQPVISKNDERIHISQWVSSKLSNGDIKSIVDSRLQGDFDTSSAWRAVEIAMASVSIISAKRPYMSDIVIELKECLVTESARKQSSVYMENKELIEFNTNLATELGPLAR